MRVFQHVKMTIIGAATVLLATSYAAVAQGGGRYWTPTTTNPTADHQHVAKEIVASKATTHKKERASRNANARRPSNAKAHNLILQVNTNDPAGEKVKIEVVTFGPGLHMLRDDTSPVKARLEEMALSTPEVSFKACGNTQERMHKAENKDIPIVRQAEVVKSGVVRVMELQEKGWSYVKP